MAKRRQESREGDADASDRSRLDRWLWTARFFKTRGLAAAAIDGGKIAVNDDRPKRARPVAPGDRVQIRVGAVEYVVIVRAIAARRGPAPEAALLYQETSESEARRAEASARLKAESALFSHQEGRPSKKDRREIARLRRKE